MLPDKGRSYIADAQDRCDGPSCRASHQNMPQLPASIVLVWLELIRRVEGIDFVHRIVEEGLRL